MKCGLCNTEVEHIELNLWRCECHEWQLVYNRQLKVEEE
jgi:hypothetical protein